MRDISENIPFNYQNQIFATRQVPIQAITNEGDQFFSATEFKFEKVIANNTPKPQLKKLAIKLRKEGKSYGEILEVVKVAKSTLSLWLREVSLSYKQKKRLTQKSSDGQKKGAARRREQGSEAKQKAYSEAKIQIPSLTEKEIWMMCTALYWAEGGKEKSYRSSKQFDFSNTDPRMLRVMIYWLNSILGFSKEDLKFEIYIHENNKWKIEEVRNFWANELSLSLTSLEKIRYKKHKPKTNRRNIGILYNGLVRVKVCSSSSLVRYLEGWVQGIDLCVGKRINQNS